MDIEKKKISWPIIAVTLGVTIITASMAGTSVWYYMDQQNQKIDDDNARQVESLETQIAELEIKAEITPSPTPISTPTPTPTSEVIDTSTGAATSDVESVTTTISANVTEISSANFQNEVIDAKGVVVVEVYAPWCPHCQKMAPIVAAYANEMAGKVKVGKMNANNQDPAVKSNFDFAVKNGLESYPTIWIYKDGKKVDTKSGQLSKDEITTWVQSYL
ncbi:MAG: thioredoxin family protein [bacterium]